MLLNHGTGHVHPTILKGAVEFILGRSVVGVHILHPVGAAQAIVVGMWFPGLPGTGFLGVPRIDRPSSRCHLSASWRLQTDLALMMPALVPKTTSSDFNRMPKDYPLPGVVVHVVLGVAGDLRSLVSNGAVRHAPRDGLGGASAPSGQLKHIWS